MTSILQSNRIFIRNLQSEDLESFYNYRKEQSVAQYQGYSVFDRADCSMFIEQQKDNEFGRGDGWQQYAIVVRGSNGLIGDCAIRFDHTINKTVEIGCTIAPQFQKQGYAKETMLLLMHALFEDHQVRRIVETTDAENLAAITLLKSIGFRKEGHFIDNIWFKGRWGSEYQYAMLKHEWMNRC